ncbi:MAG: carbon-nitrogen family hydrolase [Thermodesulfobacteriota bacterium]|nr:carbon-nitrogen family hydrolase [Thermodesulfobacteriota bacterium]
MENRRHLKAGIVQFDVKLGDVESNLETAFQGINFLGAGKADIAVLPEMWSCGFDNQRLTVHAEKTGAIIDRLSQAASKYNMIIAGSMPESFEGNIYNTMYVIDSNGDIAGTYRKIHLFSLTGEDKYFSAGNKAVVCKTSIGPVGLMICYDLRFPELCRSLALSQAILVIVSAQWPIGRTRHWDILLRARAIENQIFVVAANRNGKEGDIEYGGHSQFVTPLGDVLDIAGDKACILNARLNLSEISEFRNKIPCLNERVPGAYVI